MLTGKRRGGVGVGGLVHGLGVSYNLPNACAELNTSDPRYSDAHVSAESSRRPQEQAWRTVQGLEMRQHLLDELAVVDSCLATHDSLGQQLRDVFG